MAALGPDLYGGTAGVALFLSEAGERLDDHRARTASLGAIRHALDHSDRIEPEVRDGLYAGWIGMAFAATRVAAVLEAEEVSIRSRELLRRWARERDRATPADLMSGSAGAVAGLSPGSSIWSRSRGSWTEPFNSAPS